MKLDSRLKKLPKRIPKRIKVGSVGQKAILLLGSGIVLGLTHRPDRAMKIIREAAKEWKEIDKRSLGNSIKRLYESKLLDYKENSDGSVSVVLTEEGQKRYLRYDLDRIKLKKPRNWDGLWRMVIFDIPEEERWGRVELANKLRELGFFAIQKSVFIYPYECKDELDFIIEVFSLRSFVRQILVKETDIDFEIKNYFKLS